MGLSGGEGAREWREGGRVGERERGGERKRKKGERKRGREMGSEGGSESQCVSYMYHYITANEEAVSILSSLSLG